MKPRYTKGRSYRSVSQFRYKQYPYTMGRIFFRSGRPFRESANPGINSTIGDKYFILPAATSAVIFSHSESTWPEAFEETAAGPTLDCIIFYEEAADRSMQPHRIHTYPARMNLPQQGSFQLGYYCQTQARYQKKEEKEYV